MKKIYESFKELMQEKGYSVGIDSEREGVKVESQSLNSRPEEQPLIGIVPMTGKGVDAEVEDLSFVK